MKNFTIMSGAIPLLLKNFLDKHLLILYCNIILDCEAFIWTEHLTFETFVLHINAILMFHCIHKFKF